MDDLSHIFDGGTVGAEADLAALNPVPEAHTASARVNDLSWLDIDEQAARDVDRLPRQNLDFAPELAAQWSHENKHPLAYFVPNTDTSGYLKDPKLERAPNTVGDMSQLHGPLRLEPESQMLRLARYALMESTDLSAWQAKMFAKFSRQELTAGKTALSGILAERGLLGGYYVDAKDFPKCATSSSAQEFVRRHASQAPFVVAKTACGDCTHNQGGRCGIFHKQLVSEVPYTDELADQVAASQGARGFTASAGGDARSRIQTAFLNKSATSDPAFSGQVNSGNIVPVSRLRKASDVRAEEERLKEAQARPVVELVRRELLKGRTAGELAHAMRLSFAHTDLQATKQYWAPLVREAGLYGTVYSTQESFSDCREGADFLSKHGSKVRAIVAGDKCGSCIFNKVGRCMMYGRALVGDVEDVYTADTVAAVLDEHKMAGTIDPYLVGQEWGSNPREALQSIHKHASTITPVGKVLDPRSNVQTAFNGSGYSHVAKDLTKRDIIKVARQYLNEGLYGQDLGLALMARFESRDLVAAASELKTVLAEQGLQGIYYVDPTVYEDYGQGCKTAQRAHRTRTAVEFVKAGDKCGSCVHQTMPGVCSVLNKKLAVDIPYVDKRAQQQAVLASGSSMGTDLSTLMYDRSNIVQEYQVTGGTGYIDLNPTTASVEASIQFGNNEVDLSGL